MTNLQDKLKQYGSPEPDCDDGGGALGYEFEQNSNHAFVMWIHQHESGNWILQVDTNVQFGIIKVITTDSDWIAVANFIKFLKAQND